MILMTRPIPGFPDYEITSDGRVWSLPRKGRGAKNTGRWLTPSRKNNGYMHVSVTRNKKHYNRHVHRLVLEAFVGPRPEGMECRHLNGRRDDNRLENLCWGTPKENQHDRVRHGTSNFGDMNPSGKLTSGAVRDLRALSLIGLSLDELSDIFGIHREHVRVILLRRMWK